MASARVAIVKAAMFGLFIAASGAAVALARPAKAGAARHIDGLLATGKKFEGVGACGSCHSKGSMASPPTEPGHEQNIWQEKDQHAKAATHIIKPDYKATPWLKDVETKFALKGEALVASDQCISCHGSPVPKPMQGEKFNAAEGVSCYQCHGPSEAWKVPHQTVGWTESQRKKMDHATLLKTFGLFDTKPPVQRAEMCASCHLAIDETLVKAGHPQPVFEQLTFQFKEPEHWTDNNKGYGRLNLYAAGQVVAMRETLAQLATRPTDAGAFDQAAVHAKLVALLIDAKAIPGDASKVKAIVDAVEKGKGNAAALTAAGADAEALAPALLEAIAKQPVSGDKAALKATLIALTGDEATSLVAHGRRGIEQVAFALDRLTLAAKEGGADAVAIKALRDGLKPVRDLKLYETRNAGDAGPAAATLTTALKDLGAKVKALP